MTEPVLAVVVARRWLPDEHYVRGSTHERLCDLCGRLVALAPETVRLLTCDPGPVWCVECAVLEVEAGSAARN